MATFPERLNNAARSGDIFAGIATVVDKSGKTLFEVTAGKQNLSSNAQVPFDAALSCFSVTKLLTTICALQCVERGQIGLDDDLATHLPGLAAQPIISLGKNGSLHSTPRTSKITLRHLLSHTSGLPYDGLSPAVTKWRKDTQDLPSQWLCGNHMRAYNTPLIFEPGENFHYGAGIDWAGLLVSQLTGGKTLGRYMAENIFEPLLMSDSTFHIEEKPGLKERLLQMVARAENAKWKPAPEQLLYPEKPDDDVGGLGLISTVPDLSKVLADLVSDSPRLLKLETIEQMFTPQFDAQGAHGLGLEKNFFLYSDKIGEDPRGQDGKMKVSFGLGGAVTLEDTKNLPANTLLWGGKSHIAWFINRDIGVVGIYAAQVLPGGEPKTNAMIGDFLRETIKKATTPH